MNALCTAPSRAVRNPTTRGESCGFVDESYGPARALRAVWTARGQRGRVAHRLPTLSRLSPTSSTGPTTGDSHTTTPHNPSPRLPPPTVQDNICIPLKPIPTSPTAWLTPNPSGSFPYGIRLRHARAVHSSPVRSGRWIPDCAGMTIRTASTETPPTVIPAEAARNSYKALIKRQNIWIAGSLFVPSYVPFLADVDGLIRTLAHVALRFLHQMLDVDPLQGLGHSSVFAWVSTSG